MTLRETRRRAALTGAGLALAAAAPALGAQVTIAAYSTPQVVYQEIIPAFQKTAAGKGVTFQQSYASSGESSRSVLNGLRANYVALSLEPDITRLVKADLIPSTWNAGPTKGMVSTSVVVWMVRKGNPKKIRTWQDLTKPGVEIIQPNWQTSGGAKWNLLAAYAAIALGQRRGDQAGREYLKALYRNITVQDKSARESLQTFQSGKGDVLLGYENEAFYAQKVEKIPLDYIVPPETFLIENPAAVVPANGDASTARAFLNYVLSPQSQSTFAKLGYRPVIANAKLTKAGRRYTKRFPRVPKLSRIGNLGGWEQVDRVFFTPGSGVVAQAQRG